MTKQLIPQNVDQIKIQSLDYATEPANWLEINYTVRGEAQVMKIEPDAVVRDITDVLGDDFRMNGKKLDSQVSLRQYKRIRDYLSEGWQRVMNHDEHQSLKGELIHQDVISATYLKGWVAMAVATGLTLYSTLPDPKYVPLAAGIAILGAFLTVATGLSYSRKHKDSTHVLESNLTSWMFNGLANKRLGEYVTETPKRIEGLDNALAKLVYSRIPGTK